MHHFILGKRVHLFFLEKFRKPSLELTPFCTGRSAPGRVGGRSGEKHKRLDNRDFKSAFGGNW